MTDRTVILVVDDEPKNIQVVGSLLLREGYEVIAAREGEEAISKAIETEPDLVLLDVMMPGISGVEVALRLMAHPDWNQAPIVFLSAATDKSFVVEGLEAGAVDYVAKPFNGAELLRRIELHIGLRRARLKLEEAVAEKTRLMEVLAHDLKNPLGSVRFAARLLQERLDGARTGELVEMIHDASERALEIVESLLDASGFEHAKAGLSCESVDLKVVAEEVKASFADRAAAKGIRLELNDDARPVFVSADRKALFRALENLVSNALKFSPQATTILMQASKEGGCGLFRISDQGPGIPPDEVGRLFQRYARLSPRPTGEESSTGLGLSIVRELATAMGGSVRYQPAALAGAEFVLTLPLA